MPTQIQAHYTHRSPAPASCSTMRTSTSAATKFRDPIASMAAPALSASLSIRRLRSSGSVKGGQSPAMFPSAASGRKSGRDAFEPAEPTSPKVTCIGQVRVKKRKKKKKKKVALARTRSRRTEEGELSFRSEEVAAAGGDRANQRWVHLHVGNICEAVRALGSEINCLSPCWRPSRCHPKAKEKRPCDGARTGSCSAAFARWLMAVHEDEEEEIPTGEENAAASRDREEAAEVCVPPPNALLLMRCRSDPVRMAALESRFWGAEIDEDDEEEEDGETTRIAEPVEEVRRLEEEAGGIGEQPEADVGIALRAETADERRQEEEEKATDTRRRRHSFSADKEARRPSSEERRRSSFSSYVEQPRRSSVYLESSQRAPPDSGRPLAKQLPDCLLLMMYEPKLSMEVSRETWVCSADFVRPGALPQLHRRGDGEGAPDATAAPEVVDRSNGEEEEEEKERKAAAEPEPPSTPPEKAKAVAFGPLVLTRCKSDPVKASAKFSPELGFWMSRHQPMSAAAEVGF